MAAISEKEIEAILRAEPAVEIDRSKIKWPKRRKSFKVKWSQGKGLTETPKKQHPGTYDARKILERLGWNLNCCQNCGSYQPPIQVHHNNRNPHDNRPENLRVLCSDCHYLEHHELEEEGVILDENFERE